MPADGNEGLSKPVLALFAADNAANIISGSLVRNDSLGPVQWYPTIRQIVARTSNGEARPLEIVGELNARWYGMNKDFKDQQIFFSPMLYCTRFLIASNELTAHCDVIFDLKTVHDLDLLSRRV
ncbi:uncharacterized protein BKCO1_4700069 [Diplodia corticola]|uniref:Uncharacterized protein n=1 Tax=Diplodia corticola TaxID=236234 RepID=A0A1J9RUH9_9PEZI|nr:uncharacterized protein BKCO1_4700069 [Diplodia corticola]OJD31508.1 hypothetical protein BKCO1_4700069 [Diplodia corticola]